MPLDPEPDPVKGNVAVSPFGVVEVLSGASLEAAAEVGEPLYTSHFATCPDAAQHRRKS